MKSIPAISDRSLELLTLLLLLPALLIHLGLLAFIDDEGIRSLVALEMELSGNYVTPTLHGDYYYNKPPLYNWLLLLSFELFGRFDEWAARTPTVIFLLAYGATIYHFFRRHYPARTAFLHALVFITCGRVLFWDSMLALIDICFSWVTFSMFMVLYHEFERERYRRLFLLTYGLTAIGFLLKGLPAIVFLGISLLTYFAWRGRFRGLFSLSHVLGMGLWVLIVGGYYLIYHQYNGLDQVFTTLWSESGSRTVLRFGWWETVAHIFAFPFEMVYHFLPWSLLIIYLWRSDVLHLIRQDRFITFNGLMFLANVLPYWTSPEVYPRYLLMLAPLIFSVFVYLHDIHRREGSWQYRSLMTVFAVTCVLVSILAFSPLFLSITADSPYLYPGVLLVAPALAICTYYFIRTDQQKLLWLVLLLVLIRIEFDLFVLPDRNRNDYGDECRRSAQRIGAQYTDEALYLFDSSEQQPASSFYMTQQRRQIIPRIKQDFPPSGLYIIDPRTYPDTFYHKVDELKVRHGELKYYDIGRLEK